MRFEEVVKVLDALDFARVRAWVGGGWGVAILVGQQTRQHRDLDLAVDRDDLQLCLEALNGLGYVTETNDAGTHRASEVTTGVGGRAPGSIRCRRSRHAGGPDKEFHYPPEAFTHGVLNGRLIPCLSASQQRTFRSGYELRAEDRHDLKQLNSIEPP